MAIAVSAPFVKVVAVAALASVLLTACSSSGDAEQSLSLVETKSPVQLLRNEAASRVPAEFVEEILNTEDESTSCRTVETDPEGLLRSWRSVIRFELVNDTSIDPQDVVEVLVDSFVDDGWDRGSYGVVTIIELTRPGSETNIHISLSDTHAEDDTGAEIQLAVAGPCVMTEGKTSDEVTSLGDVRG